MSLPESRIDCPHHRVILDPDPYDWFCDDDVVVVCTHPLTPRQEPQPSSSFAAKRQAFKPATVGCRPYRTREETTPVPTWCPLREVSDPFIETIEPTEVVE